MTIAITLKVNDGVVFAADSALTISKYGEKGATRVYYNTHKVFKLSDNPPTGVVICGCGIIGSSSMADIINNIRGKLESTHNTVESIAEFFKVNVNNLYSTAFSDWTEPEKLTCFIAGYCNSEIHEYVITIDKEQCTFLKRADRSALFYTGESESIARLIKGYSPTLIDILTEILNSFQGGEPLIQLIRLLDNELPAKFIVPGMPIHDAIGLCRFLVQTSIDYAKFSRGPQTVGGPIEIAAITKHDGFKWIQRNEHFSNQEVCVC